MLQGLARSLKDALAIDKKNKKLNTFNKRLYLKLMNVTIVDYQSGNISSVINSFTEVAKGKVNLEVTSDIKK